MSHAPRGRSWLPAAALALAVAGACEPVETSPPEEEADPAAANAEVARAYLQAYNDRDLATIEETFADPLSMNGETTERDALLEAIQGYWQSFPDIELREHHMLESGEYVTVRMEFDATGSGEYFGHEVDGKAIGSSEMILFRFRDGRITEYWYEWDALGFWTQLGVVEDPYAGG